jgi:hypothetical protein
MSRKALFLHMVTIRLAQMNGTTEHMMSVLYIADAIREADMPSDIAGAVEGFCEHFIGWHDQYGRRQYSPRPEWMK